MMRDFLLSLLKSEDQLLIQRRGQRGVFFALLTEQRFQPAPRFQQ